MADKIKINTKTLANDTTSIQTYIKQIEGKIEKMETDVTDMNKMWSGTANEEFNQAFEKDMKALKEICKSLKEIVEYETTAKTEYNTCENKVSSLIAEISI